MSNDTGSSNNNGNTGLLLLILILGALTFILLLHVSDALVLQNLAGGSPSAVDSAAHASGIGYLYRAMFDFLDRVAAISAKMVTWPFAAITFAMLFFWRDGHNIFFSFLGRATKFKFAQMEIELSEEGAKNLQTNARRVFTEFKKLADAEFQRQLNQYNVRHCLRNTLKNVNITVEGRPKKLMDVKDVRCTIHVRDIMFTDNLLQLIDYYPGGGGGAMRRFSIRYGAIGRTWRMESHFGMSFSEEITPEQLVKKWGMTQNESEKVSRGGASYLCVLLTNNDKVPIAVLYLDSKTPKAFGTDEEAQKSCDILEVAARNNGLSKALEDVTNELKKYASNIDIQIDR